MVEPKQDPWKHVSPAFRREQVCLALAGELERIDGSPDQIALSLGVSRAYVLKLLRGLRFPSPEMLLLIRRSLGIDLNKMFDEIEDK